MSKPSRTGEKYIVATPSAVTPYSVSINDGGTRDLNRPRLYQRVSSVEEGVRIRDAFLAGNPLPPQIPSWAKLGDDDGSATAVVQRPASVTSYSYRHPKFCAWLKAKGIALGEVKPIAHLEERRQRDDVRKGLIQAAEKQHFNAVDQPLQLDAEPPHACYYEFAEALGVRIDVYREAANA